MYPGHEFLFRYVAWAGSRIRTNQRHPTPPKLFPYLVLQLADCSMPTRPRYSPMDAAAQTPNSSPSPRRRWDWCYRGCWWRGNYRCRGRRDGRSRMPRWRRRHWRCRRWSRNYRRCRHGFRCLNRSRCRRWHGFRYHYRSRCWRRSDGRSRRPWGRLRCHHRCRCLLGNGHGRHYGCGLRCGYRCYYGSRLRFRSLRYLDIRRPRQFRVILQHARAKEGLISALMTGRTPHF